MTTILEGKIEGEKSKRTAVILTVDNIKRWTGIQFGLVHCQNKGQTKFKGHCSQQSSRGRWRRMIMMIIIHYQAEIIIGDK